MPDRSPRADRDVNRRLLRAVEAPAADSGVIELGSEHLASIPERSEVNIARLIVEELRKAQPGFTPTPPRLPLPAEPTALVARPGPWWQLARRQQIAAALAFAVGWNVIIGAYLVLRPAASSAEAVRSTGGRASAPMPCAVTSEPKLLARSVLQSGGVEATSASDRIAFGVVKGPREGVALELDPASLAVRASAAVVTHDPLGRVLPALPLDAPVEASAELSSDHVVAGSDGDAYAISAKSGFLTWRGRDAEAGARLWPTATDIEAPRAVRVAPGGGWLLVFRRESAIWMGIVDVDGRGVRPGALSQVSEASAQVGAPSIDARGKDAVATWAERGKEGPWTVKWARWKNGIRVGPAHALAAPPEGAFAPSLVLLEGDRFLLAWTEGGLHHRVRAVRIGPDERPIGEPLDVSPRGVDAGQARVALGPDGRGTAAYLAAHAQVFDLVAAGLTCR